MAKETETGLPAGHPGRILKEKLSEKCWTMDDLALITGSSRQNLSLIVTEKRRITPDMAVTLGAAFGNEPAEWLKWDAEHQLSLVTADPEVVEGRARLYETAPIREMLKRGWIRDGDVGSELNRFFGDRTPFPVATLRSDPLHAPQSS